MIVLEFRLQAQLEIILEFGMADRGSHLDKGGYCYISQDFFLI